VIGVPNKKHRSKKVAKASEKVVAGRDRPSQAVDASPAILHRSTGWISAALEHKDESRLLKEALDLVADQFPCDLVEINLLDESVGSFIPTRWANSKGKPYLKNLASDRYQLGEGYTGWLAEHRSPLLIQETFSHRELTPKTGLESFPFKSYLGVPLLWEQNLLGTLELAHHSPASYSQEECEALLGFSSQLALALHVCRLQHKVDQQVIQQAAVNAMCQLAEHINEIDALWEGLSRALLDTLELSLLGIFIQIDGPTELSTPFLFHKQGKSWKHNEAILSAPVGSDLSAIWLHQEYWLSNKVDNAVLSTLALDQATYARCLNKILITPILAGSERLGLMIAGRKKKQRDFSEGEIITLQSLGRQAGIMLHSSQELAQATSLRAQKTEGGSVFGLEEAEATISPERMAELLRLSAELTTSLDLDRSLRRVLGLCNELMLADRAVFITRSNSSGELSLRQVMPDYESRVSQQAEALESVSLSISEWLVAHRQSLLLNDLSHDGRWPLEGYSSLCAVPCVSDNDVTGVLLFFTNRTAAFSSDEQQIAQIVARQMASALNNSYLYSVIREQADRLGLMLRSQQIETSQSNAILESIADGVIVTDANHRVILYNTAAERILTLPTSQVIGKEVFDHIGIFGSETIQWGEAIRQWRLTPPEEHQQPTIPERMILDDGRIISILPAPVVLGGDFLGTVSIFRDISREVEVDRLKSEFVATVSHELRTPMTSIKGFVDLMLMGAAGDLNEEQQHFLDIVRTNTNRLEILVNDLLDISRIEAGKASLVFQELDVYQLLVEMEQYIQHRSHEESKTMQFTFEAQKTLAPIWGDLERVRQILANIVENSFDYTPEGGLIHMQARQVDDHIEIEVTDNGMGISIEEQERIFERFYRGEQALIMGVSGTGLGLAIVLNLVEMHGGRIWVMSEGVLGKGTTFTVSLPTEPPTSH
jgi:PAS domain S-box-containing protein